MGCEGKSDGKTSQGCLPDKLHRGNAFFIEYWSHVQTKADTGPSSHRKETLSMCEGGWPLKTSSHQISRCYFMNSLWPKPHLLGLLILNARSPLTGERDPPDSVAFVYFSPASPSSGFSFQGWCEVDAGCDIRDVPATGNAEPLCVTVDQPLSFCSLYTKR